MKAISAAGSDGKTLCRSTSSGEIRILFCKQRRLKLSPRTLKRFPFLNVYWQNLANRWPNRNFHYAEMLYPDGHFVNHWGDGSSVPDMSRLETRMWFYFLATSYIDVGIEAIHVGQVGLMDNNDPGHAGWLDMLGRVRAYAHQHARRHLLICDAHTPTGGYVENRGCCLIFTLFPCVLWR